tara:strand:+ start:22605 stop:23090 length:486 start_codon:yes stop_codon:yes gene_type:complete
MKLLKNHILISIITIALSILLLAGCGSDSDHDDHDEVPVGLVLSVNGTELAMQEETTVTYASGNHIELSQNATLGPILVEFISEDGDRFTPHSDEGFSLQYSAESSNIITMASVTGANEWTFQLIGNEAGETTIRFQLMHSGHSDFESRPFQVRVTSLQPQ